MVTKWNSLTLRKERSLAEDCRGTDLEITRDMQQPFRKQQTRKPTQNASATTIPEVSSTRHRRKTPKKHVRPAYKSRT